MSRAVSGHAAGIGIAGALSFLFAGSLNAVAGWEAAFFAAAGCALGAWLLVFFTVPRAPRKPPGKGPRPGLFEFGPVLRNRSAMAYACAYCVHTWEMNVLRGWGVAFLAFTAARTGDPAWLAPTVIVTVLGLMGTAASIAGNELAIRLGRQPLVRAAMLLSAVFALTIGYLGSLSYHVAAAAVVLYAVVIWADSSALTAGAAGSAEPSRRGATLAVHSMLGYGGGFLGPLVIGWVLDWSGGMSPEAWWLAFAHVGVVVLIGRCAFVLLRPKTLAGDRGS